LEEEEEEEDCRVRMGRGNPEIAFWHSSPGKLMQVLECLGNL